MVGAAAMSDVIPDISVNNLDGVLYFTAGAVEPYGQASPVETDPSSKAFYGNNNTVFSPFEAARISVAHDALISPSGDFTLRGFIKFNGGASHTPQMYFGKGSGNPITNNNCFFIGTDNLTQRIVGGMWDNANNFWSVTDGTYLIDPTVFYFVSLKRVGNSLVLGINGITTAITTITSGLPTREESQPFFVHCPQTSPMTAFYDEPALYTHAVSDARLLIHFESSRAINNMYGTIAGKSTAELNSAPPPVYAGFLYGHNFTTSTIERLSRPTTVQLARDGSEERTGRATQTRRKLAYDSLIKDASTRRKFSSFLWANQYKPVAWPIIIDNAKLIEDMTAGDTVILVDTQFKDYDVDGRVMISQDNNFEIGEIDSFDSSSVTLKSPLINDWPIGSRIAPVKRAYIEQTQSIVGLTSEVQQATVNASILVEDIVASPNRITAHTPEYTYQGVEVFNPFEWGMSNFAETQDHDSVQDSELLDETTGVFRVDADITKSRTGIGYQLLLSGRDKISSFLGWFENRAGRLNKLWVPSLQEDFKLVQPGALSGSTITITDTDYADTYNVDDFRRDIAIINLNRTMAFRRINSVAQSDPNEILTVNSSVAALALTARKVCLLRMCRLDADEIELSWETNAVVRVAFKFREVLEY